LKQWLAGLKVEENTTCTNTLRFTQQQQQQQQQDSE
jgi:hypothetical protein